MTTTAAHRRVTPTLAEVAKETAIIRQFLGLTNTPLVNVYVAGYLSSLTKRIADEHAAHCRTPHCVTCWHLRCGLALVTAFDDITGGTT